MIKTCNIICYLVSIRTITKIKLYLLRTGGRVVEGIGLENRRTSNCIVGSNPTLSAK